MTRHDPPLHLADLSPAVARQRLTARPALLLPVGSNASVAPHLPLGAETRLVEAVASRVARERALLVAPTLHYGVQPLALARDGGATLRRKTLHRVINELIDSWETGAGIRHLVIVTAHASDQHLEALSTVRAERAQVTTIDLLGADFAVPGAPADAEPRRIFHLTEMLDFLVPDLLPQAAGPSAGSDRPRHGGAMLGFLVERILRLLDQVLAAPEVR